MAKSRMSMEPQPRCKYFELVKVFSPDKGSRITRAAAYPVFRHWRLISAG
jgi:hypothetical protein